MNQNSSKRSNLVERTKQLLKNRPAELTYKKIEAETGLTVAWLTHFASHSDVDPAAGKIVTLYEYLSGKELEVR